MSAWKNKHVVIATLMAPVLALIAYFGVHHMLGEEPRVAEAGQSYQLVEKPNCRYGSGACGLKNSSFELTLTHEWLGDSRMLLKLESIHPLDGVLLAMAENETDEGQPVEMQAITNDGLSWSLEMGRPDPDNNRLRLVASAGGALYFGDVSTKFTLERDSID